MSAASPFLSPLSIPNHILFIAGATAGSVAALIMNPLYVIRTHLQATLRVPFLFNIGTSKNGSKKPVYVLSVFFIFLFFVFMSKNMKIHPRRRHPRNFRVFRETQSPFFSGEIIFKKTGAEAGEEFFWAFCIGLNCFYGSNVFLSLSSGC